MTIGLQKATAEINRIVERVERNNEDSSRHLSFIRIEGRLMLVWVQSDETVVSADEEDEVAKALGLDGYD